jgi:hypothetical protein
MAEYFDKFPKTPYNINYNSELAKNFDMPVNILVRVGVLISKLDQVFHYYDYAIKEGETPEIVADKFYDNPEAHWLVLLTNNIIDPQYDWVLHYDAFGKYIVSKYGSLANAKTSVHHYELIRKTQDVTTDLITYGIHEITSNTYSNLVASGTPVVEPTNYTTYTVGGKIVRVFPDATQPYYLRTVYNYDWEDEQNEKRRNIKLIKREYYSNIVNEFTAIMAEALPTRKKFGVRSLV